MPPDCHITCLPTVVNAVSLVVGTGGAGPTIMETTLLLAGEEVAAYK